MLLTEVIFLILKLRTHLLFAIVVESWVESMVLADVKKIKIKLHATSNTN